MIIQLPIKKLKNIATNDLIKCYHKLMIFIFLKINENFTVENCREENKITLLKNCIKE